MFIRKKLLAAELRVAELKINLANYIYYYN